MGADRDRTRDPPTVKPKVKPSRYEAAPEIFIIRYDIFWADKFFKEIFSFIFLLRSNFHQDHLYSDTVTHVYRRTLHLIHLIRLKSFHCYLGYLK